MQRSYTMDCTSSTIYVHSCTLDPWARAIPHYLEDLAPLLLARAQFAMHPPHKSSERQVACTTNTRHRYAHEELALASVRPCRAGGCTQ